MDPHDSIAPRHPLRSTHALLLLAALAAPLRADVVVTRTVRADRAARPDAAGAPELCPHRAERPTDGERVTLSVAPGRARRDETAASFVVDLDAGRALVIDHQAHSYAELAYPVPLSALVTAKRSSLGAGGEERWLYRLRTPVYESIANREGGSRVTRAARVGNGFGTELEVEVEVEPDAALGRAALAVEDFAQTVRGSGESWLSVLTLPEGIPLALVEELQVRRSSVRYREFAPASQPAQLDAALFAPPVGYQKVEHRPDCF